MQTVVMEAPQDGPEVLIADQIIDDRLGPGIRTERGGTLGRPGSRPTLGRRHTFTATLLLIVMAVAALAVASIIAVGVIIIAVVLVVVGLIARLASAISTK